ncbi:hypothetical protein D3C76_1519210 [compost metagenome]
MTPKDIVPFIARTAPTTQTATKPRLPINIIIGIIRPERNCALNALSLRFIFRDSNVLRICDSPL